MNKYLLLRDNKQSGPYTVAEIIEIGIKPYDLVWHDGKSIAWRYPSEIAELKAYAPAVEEQPFDRFYKKPETSTAATTATIKSEHAAYVPKTTEPDEAVHIVAAEEVPPARKVYINFPAHTAPEKKPIPITPQPEKIPLPVTPQAAPFTSQKQLEEQRPAFPERTTPAYNYTQSRDNKFIYYSAAAALVLIGFIVFLLVNNSNQQEKLKELNTIVKQIETKNAQQASLVSNVQPAPLPAQPQVSETIVNPELLADNNDYSKPTSPVTPQAKNDLPPAQPSSEPKEDKTEQNNSGIVYKERPVLRRSDSETAKPANDEPTASTGSAENIFKLVDVSANSYKTGVLGGISNLQLHLTNNSKHELHKVAILVKYLGPEKKVVNTQTVYFENVAPGEKATIDVPKSKRGVSIDYVVTDIKS